MQFFQINTYIWRYGDVSDRGERTFETDCLTLPQRVIGFFWYHGVLVPFLKNKDDV